MIQDYSFLSGCFSGSACSLAGLFSSLLDSFSSFKTFTTSEDEAFCSFKLDTSSFFCSASDSSFLTSVTTSVLVSITPSHLLTDPFSLEAFVNTPLAPSWPSDFLPPKFHTNNLRFLT
ncbi:hypothetical protein BpHYR1_005583 [Brachionus plicatilis]|uniref:Uncharacterized protein n=1 Tax=Brachionus plicatilis TaxID=10195 RepID=A0A3M7RIQ0_BRAPC|nr:hypothetical protein BpHYR1_005583 [Brachionus plicatilis]